MNAKGYAQLEKYVGKVFYMDYAEVQIVLLLGGESGPPFFLCKWLWSDMVYTADPLDVIPFFDDNLEPIREFDFPE